MSRNSQRKIWFYVPTYHYGFMSTLHLSVLSIGLLSLAIATSGNDNNDHKTAFACQSDVFSISCHGKTIIIVSAFYGRLDKVTCVNRQATISPQWDTNCRSNRAAKRFRNTCNNKTNCTLNLANNSFNDWFGDPCPGTPKYLSVNYTCFPAPTTSAVDCHCHKDFKRNVEWPLTECGSNINQSCPNNKRRHKAFRECSKWESNGVWMHPNLAGCIAEEIERMRKETDGLKINFSVDSTIGLMSRVRYRSGRNDLYGGDLYELTTIIVDLVMLNFNNINMLNYSVADNLTELMLNSTGSLLNVNNETWTELLPADRSQTATRLLDALETSCNVLAKAAESPTSIKKSAAGIQLEINVINVTQTGSVELNTPDLRLDIILEGGAGLASFVFVTYDDIEKRLGVFPLGNSMGQDPNESSTELTHEPRDNATSIQSFIITKVVSVQIVSCDRCSVKIKFPIRFTLQHKWESPNSTIPSCVFWEYTKPDYDGHWSTDRCTVVSSNRYNTTCECDHLTAYSVLMTGAVNSQSAIVTKVSGIFTTIGCSISVVALILTIIIYAVTWKEVKSHQAVVLLNLCVALIAAQTIFLTGVDKVDPEIGCKVVAVLLHYFFLAAFFIMLVEGIQLLIYAVFVFHAKRKRETASLLVAAWVLPLIIVSISLGVNKTGGYGSKDICWLSVENNFIWAFVGPVITIVGVNIIITIIVLTRTYSSNLRSNQNSKSKIRGIFWNVAVICPILGLTWLLGVFSQRSAVMVFVFTIVNSLQGLFILIFHAIFLNKKFSGRLSSLAMRCMSFVRSLKRQKPSEKETTTKSNAIRVGKCCYDEIQSRTFPNAIEEQTVSINNSTAFSTMSSDQSRTANVSILNTESTNF